LFFIKSGFILLRSSETLESDFDYHIITSDPDKAQKIDLACLCLLKCHIFELTRTDVVDVAVTVTVHRADWSFLRNLSHNFGFGMTGKIRHHGEQGFKITLVFSSLNLFKKIIKMETMCQHDQKEMKQKVVKMHSVRD
jgi:hypothetical protein